MASLYRRCQGGREACQVQKVFFAPFAVFAFYRKVSRPSPRESLAGCSALCSKFDAAGRNIKYPCLGVIDATAGSVCHDEIIFRIGVPRPKGITAFNQVINDNELSWIEIVSAIAAYTLWYGLI